LFTHGDNSVTNTPARGLDPISVYSIGHMHISNPQRPGSVLDALMAHPPAGAHAVDEQPNAFEAAWLDEQVPARPAPVPCTGRPDCIAGAHFPGSAALDSCAALHGREGETEDEYRARHTANETAWWAGERQPGEYGDSETTMVYGFGHGHGSLLDGPDCDAGAGCRAMLHRPDCAELDADRQATDAVRRAGLATE
jgi:hypothetical protein